jgi:stage II sporulation protein D
LRRTTVFLALGLIACSSRAPSRVVNTPPRARPVPTRPDDLGKIVRVVLATSDRRVSAAGDFDFYDEETGTRIGHGKRGESWLLERERGGVRVRAVASEGGMTAWTRAMAVTSQANLLIGLRRYRGRFVVLPVDSGLMVVNHLRVEDYLRGVVPVEIGKLAARDSAAMQAQAVAARSYTYVRLSETVPRAFDMRPTTSDQVYGGVGAETEVGNAAIDATRGLVVMYQGRVVDAPFYSTCGGTTADANEAWSGPASAYLRRVSDQVPNSPRFYCDQAGRFRWTRTFSAADLNATMAQYLRRYASVPASGPGALRAVNVQNRGGSGRVTLVQLETDRGKFPVRGDDIRSVIRAASGEPLSSTYFSLAPEYDRDGLLKSVTVRGQGYGHGVGMCQWGAIGRARAGQSFLEILGTYYPGTTVGPIY